MRDYVYRNKDNSRKYIELRRYADGHYVWKQYIKYGDFRNYTGCNFKQNKRGGLWHRVNKQTFVEVLADYELEVAV